MRWTVVIAVAAVAAAAAATLVPSPADAQSRRVARQTVEEDYPGQRALRAGRGPTRITVRRQRSYLDPGTEVLPLSRNYTDYAIPPNHNPMGVVAGPTAPAGWQNPRWPLPGPMELGSNRW